MGAFKRSAEPETFPASVHAVTSHAGFPGVADMPVVSKTSDFNIATSGHYDNVGASGTIAGTVTGGSGTVGAIARVADFEVRLTPPSGKQIIWSGGVATADKYLRIISTLGVLKFIRNAAGDLQVISEFGNIVVQA